MFKSQKKLLLYQLDIYNIIYIAILKIFFSEIFYIKISGCIQNLAIIKILQRFKINWMNFQDYDIGEIYCESIKNNINFSDYISLILTEKIWDADIKSIYLKKDYLAACLFLKIQKKYQKIFEIFEISKILSKNHNKISILLHKDFFTKSIYEKYYSYYSFAMLPIVNFSFLRIFLNLLFFISFII